MASAHEPPHRCARTASPGGDAGAGTADLRQTLGPEDVGFGLLKALFRGEAPGPDVARLAGEEHLRAEGAGPGGSSSYALGLLDLEQDQRAVAQHLRDIRATPAPGGRLDERPTLVGVGHHSRRRGHVVDH